MELVVGRARARSSSIVNGEEKLFESFVSL